MSTERYSYLSKGINLAFWFWIPQEDFSDIQDRFSDQDFRFLKEAGFTFVRLPIDLGYLLDEGSPDLLDIAHLAEIDAALDRLLAAGLAVVVDIHSTASPEENSPVYSERLEKDRAFLSLFTAFWEAFAGHLARYDSERVFLELLNEPLFEGEADEWPPMLNEIAMAARRGAPEHTLLVSGTQWSNIDGLLLLEPLPDQNIFYYFHFYEPLTFTHQGADWAGDDVLNLHDIPYPSSTDFVSNALSLADSKRDRETISSYGQEFWNYEHIRARIQKAADWADRHNVKLICDEFGAYHETITAEGRAVWVRDVRLALESFRIGWAMWEYDGDFALVKREMSGGSLVIQPYAALMAALGLEAVNR
ncbi:MAG: cellulase family glycosylhydrolase [Anaerolineaceae bacterium]|nr:cellulase family glycosylhydrolase [Anaerolineaceae bacterium]